MQKNKTECSKLSPFELLVNNIMASKFVVLSSLIESNYVLRKAHILTENIDEIQVRDQYQEKFLQH